MGMISQSEAGVANKAKARLVQRGLVLEYLTIAWSVISAVVAVAAGLSARSAALIAFGLDSVIEAFGGGVVVWQLRGVREERERQAMRLIGVAFLLLAVYVVVQATLTLVSQRPPEKSPVGIALTAASLVIMAWLGWAKRETGLRLGNPVLLKEATVTFIDAGLSATLLVGLLLNAVFGLWWADPLAALGLAALAAKEGLEAWREG
jgi:divalent metal cation (Fe/Co/Zn/Cd) transporter